MVPELLPRNQLLHILSDILGLLPDLGTEVDNCLD